jgi:xanthine dehydrogenase accessory factor
MRELLAELNRVLQEGRSCVFCSVVETRGSTPQKPGAAMLVYPDGGQFGTLGGGCVEAEVKQRALRGLSSTSTSKPEILRFCLDDDYGWDDGLICGGRMAILADPLMDRSAASAYYRHYHEIVEASRGCIEAVVMNDASAPAGNRYLFDAQRRLVAQLADVPVPQTVSDRLPDMAKRPGPAVEDSVAYLPTLPRSTLLIVGGGHVGEAVARLAHDVNFEVWVVDDRERFVSPERFPSAQRRIVGDIGQTLEGLAREAVNDSFYCIIVTRGHSHDEEALFRLVLTPAAYVGMIGSRRKIKLIYEDLIARGIPEQALARVHAPLGIDIGSRTVAEISVSIVAELIACRNLGTPHPSPRAPVRASTTKS